MKIIILSAATLGLLFSATCFAAAPVAAPAGSTGLCKDGSYYSGPEKKGACRGHKGVKDWYGATPVAASPVVPATKPNASAAATPSPTTSITTPSKPITPVSAPAITPAPATTTTTAPAPSGSGMVWANMDSKVYHCPNSRWYGKTKKGEYMTQADANAKGLRPDHGKACQ